MKIRTGFVSNSSSSSFIVALDKKPESAEEMKELLFGDKEYYENPYQWGNRPASWSTSQVAETVFGDIEDQKPASIEEIAEEMNNGWLDGAPDLDNFKDKEGNCDWTAYNKASKGFAEGEANRYLKRIKGKEVYIVEYCDNDGVYFSALEHGNLFDGLPHHKVGKH